MAITFDITRSELHDLNNNLIEELKKFYINNDIHPIEENIHIIEEKTERTSVDYLGTPYTSIEMAGVLAEDQPVRFFCVKTGMPLGIDLFLYQLKKWLDGRRYIIYRTCPIIYETPVREEWGIPNTYYAIVTRLTAYYNFPKEHKCPNY